MFENFDFTPGKIIHFDFDLDSNIPLNKNNPDLHEDMLQVEFPSHIILDVGWYRSEFIITVVQGKTPEMWTEPLIKIKSKKLEDLHGILLKCTETIRNILDNK